MAATTPLRIAVVGGGLGGLTLALVIKTYLSEKPLAIDVYESGPKFAEVGAGISAWNRTCWIFSQIGLEGLLQKRITESLTFRKSDAAMPSQFHTFVPPYGSLALPRVEMLNYIVDAIQPNNTSFLKTSFSKRLVSYDQTEGGVTMHFTDGSFATADVLIGADGVGSATRKQMYTDLAKRDSGQADTLRKLIPPTWTGTYAYRALVDLEKVKSAAANPKLFDAYMLWCGWGKHAVTYPITPTVLNVVFFVTESDGLGRPITGSTASTATREEIIELFKDWEPDLKVVAERVDQTSKWAISNVLNLPTYIDRRVVLLGDAAHAMSTHLAAGASQAIEDAFILGRILTHPLVNKDNILDALKIYDAVRRPIAEDICRRSLRLGSLYELEPVKDVDAKRLHAGGCEELAQVADEIEDIWSFHFKKLPREDWEKAEEMLRKM